MPTTYFRSTDFQMHTHSDNIARVIFVEIQGLSASWGHGGVEREEMWSCAELQFCMCFTPRTTQRMLRTQGNACTTVKAGASVWMDKMSRLFLKWYLIIYGCVWFTTSTNSFPYACSKIYLPPRNKVQIFFFHWRCPAYTNAKEWNVLCV